MASIINDPNGRKHIEFNGIDGKRRGIRLGKAPLRDAVVFKSRLEYLTSIRIQGSSPDAETSKWLASLPAKVQGKLSKAGLIESKNAAAITKLLPFIDEYIANRTDAKERTLINLRTARDYLAKHFGADTMLDSVTPGHADEFYRFLIRPKDQKGAGLGLNTARRICGRAKQFFAIALKKRLLTENPFAGIKCRVHGSSEDRKYFVTRAEAEKVLAACPDNEWRLIFALSRFAGLRCPSEHLALRWSDIDWQRDRFTVRSPKTEHHEGKASRVIPIFPELRPHLEAARAEAPKDAEYVIGSYRLDNANLRSRLFRIIKAAGLKPWPKVFHNLRSSRQTELAGQFPIHVVCDWIGNSVAIAQKHYLQVTESHLAKAIGEVDAKVTQNMAEHRRITEKSGRIANEQEIDNFPDVPQDSPKLIAIPDNLASKPGVPLGVLKPRLLPGSFVFTTRRTCGL